MDGSIINNLKDEITNKNAFANYNGVFIDTIGEDHAEGHMEIKSESLNPYGMVHGGAYFTLADVTAGYAAKSNGKKYVTQQSSTSFLRPVSKGTIFSEAIVLNRSQNFCIVDVKIFDERRRLSFCGNFNYYLVD